MSEQGIADIARAGENIRHEVGHLVGALRREQDNLTRRVRERPIVAMGAAFGIGFILGGGLATRVGARLLLTGFRLAAAEMARRFVTDIGEEVGEEAWVP